VYPDPTVIDFARGAGGRHSAREVGAGAAGHSGPVRAPSAHRRSPPDDVTGTFRVSHQGGVPLAPVAHVTHRIGHHGPPDGRTGLGAGDDRLQDRRVDAGDDGVILLRSTWQRGDPHSLARGAVSPVDPGTTRITCAFGPRSPACTGACHRDGLQDRRARDGDDEAVRL